jgi:hypothetical protein
VVVQVEDVGDGPLLTGEGTFDVKVYRGDNENGTPAVAPRQA